MTDNTRRRGVRWWFAKNASAFLPRISACFFLLSFPSFWAVSPSFAQTAKPIRDPKLFSIFPLGGRPGTTLQAEIWGGLLEGGYAIWSGTTGVSGTVLAVDEVKGNDKDAFFAGNKKLEKPQTLYRVRVELQIQSTAPLGIHGLRLIGARGISDAVPFRVLNEKVLQEPPSPHQTIRDAIPFDIPGIINGRLEKPGELDYYSFHAKQGQILKFDLVFAQNCNPQLTLYRAAGSWFDSARLTRLMAQEQQTSDLMPADTRWTFRFLQDGTYYLEVSGLFGKGSEGSSYQVRVDSGKGDSPSEASSWQTGGEWLERNFTRELDPKWMANLQGRTLNGADDLAGTVRKTSMDSSGSEVDSEKKLASGLKTLLRPVEVVEHEPNDQPSQAQYVPIPSLVEGRIESPGDIDNYKIKVEAGQKLAFEIETPDAKPPYFNPRLGVIDSQDHELLSNVELRLSMYNNNSDPQVYLKGMEPKVVYTFAHGGDYIVQVRDITSRYGSASFRYRILIRPQIPHVGAVCVMEGDRINLVRGKPKKLTIVASYEEGFPGDVSFSFTGLPTGVQALPTTQFDDSTAPVEVTKNPEVISPKQQKTSIVLLAGAGVKLTSQPQIVQLHCWPILKGDMGPELLVREFPLMVVEGVPKK